MNDSDHEGWWSMLITIRTSGRCHPHYRSVLLCLSCPPFVLTCQFEISISDLLVRTLCHPSFRAKTTMEGREKIVEQSKEQRKEQRAKSKTKSKTKSRAGSRARSRADLTTPCYIQTSSPGSQSSQLILDLYSRLNDLDMTSWLEPNNDTVVTGQWGW